MELNKITISLLFFALIFLLNPISTEGQTQFLTKENTLQVHYYGKADSVFIDIKGHERIKLLKAKNDFWEKSIEIENVEGLLFQYKMIEYKDSEEKHGEYNLWTGKNVTPLYKKKDRINGKLIDEKIWSNSLQEKRKLTIYLPEAYDKSKRYPIIYFADGNVVNEYANYVERLIDTKKIHNVILVGVHSVITSEADKLDMSKNKRTIEYLNGITKFIPKADSTRFKKHMVFFCEEIVDYIEKKYLENKEKRALYGFSNGASFAVSAGLKYPELFTNIIALSIGWELSYKNATFTKIFPKFYISPGSLEKDFYTISKKWSDILSDNHKEFSFNKTIGFHDDIMWRQEFLSALEKIYVLN